MLIYEAERLPPQPPKRSEFCECNEEIVEGRGRLKEGSGRLKEGSGGLEKGEGWSKRRA